MPASGEDNVLRARGLIALIFADDLFAYVFTVFLGTPA